MGEKEYLKQIGTDGAVRIRYRIVTDRETKTTIQLPTREMFVAYAELDLADR